MNDHSTLDLSTVLVALGYAYTTGFIGYKVGRKRVVGPLTGAAYCICLGIVLGLICVCSSRRLDTRLITDAKPSEDNSPA